MKSKMYLVPMTNKQLSFSKPLYAIICVDSIDGIYNSIKRILRSDIMKESVIYQEIFHEGEVKVEKEVIRNIALNMLRNNMNMDDIAKLTGLTLEEIE